MGGQTTSQMESSKHGMSKSDMKEDGNMSHSTGKDGDMDRQGSTENNEMKDNFYKVKNVFEILIQEAPYLIDDKSAAMCEERSNPKEKFLILIDSCRKSLGIESMEDVELLVETFYEFGDKKRQRVAEEEEQRRLEREENMSNNNAPPVQNGKDAKKDKKEKNDHKKEQANHEPPPEELEEEEEVDPTKPDLDLDDVCECLEEFH